MRKILVLLLCLSAASYFDYRRDKIPNVIIGFGMLTGVFYQAYVFFIGCVREESGVFLPPDGNVRGLFLQLVLEIALLMLRMGTIFGFFYPLYKLGMLGAGDVKLFCLLAFFLKGRECAVCIAGSLAISALIGAGKFLVQRNLRERMGYFCSYVTDVVKNKEFRLYFANMGWQEKRKASLHMAGTVLLSVLLYAGGVYGMLFR